MGFGRISGILWVFMRFHRFRPGSRDVSERFMRGCSAFQRVFRNIIGVSEAFCSVSGSYMNISRYYKGVSESFWQFHLISETYTRFHGVFMDAWSDHNRIQRVFRDILFRGTSVNFQGGFRKVFRTLQNGLQMFKGSQGAPGGFQLPWIPEYLWNAPQAIWNTSETLQ